METSILNTIKKLLGIDSTYTAFDTDIIVAINSAFSVLTQLGMGPTSGYRITGTTETWANYLGTAVNLDLVKDYIYLKVRYIFDPPSSSFAVNAINEQIKEYEWRINTLVDNEEE